MDADKSLSEKVKDYQELAKENKNIDVASLMINALENQKSNLVSASQKRWAYLTSVGVPPFGLLWALKFYFGDEDDAKSTAIICVVLTVVSLIMLWILLGSLFSGAGVTPEQVEQIKPQGIIDLTK